MDDFTILQSLCDRLLPGDERHPGAVALELHAKLYTELSRAQRPGLVSVVTGHLRDCNFVSRPLADQDELLDQWLRGTDRRDVFCVTLRRIHLRLVSLYYSRRESWQTLGYSRPQPGGYPAYDGYPGESA